jgi:hypothetical protein
MVADVNALSHDLAILFGIGLLGAINFVITYELIQRTRWGR